jgi:hypothetical protein
MTWHIMVAEIFIKNRFDALLRPIVGINYDRNAPLIKADDKPGRCLTLELFWWIVTQKVMHLLSLVYVKDERVGFLSMASECCCGGPGRSECPA